MTIPHYIVEWSVISEQLLEEKEIQKNLQGETNDVNRNKAWILGHSFVQSQLTDLCGQVKNSSWAQTAEEPESRVVGHGMTVQRLSATESDINLSDIGYIRLSKASTTSSFPNKHLHFTSFPHLLSHTDALMPWYHFVFHKVSITQQMKQITQLPGKNLCTCPAPSLLTCPPPSYLLWWSLLPHVVLQRIGTEIFNDDLPGKWARSEQAWLDPEPSHAPPRTPKSITHSAVAQWD